MRHILLLLLTTAFYQISLGQGTWFDKIVETINRDTLQQERINAVKPLAHKQVGQWSPFIKQDMDKIWQSIGLKGVNYYCVGEPEKNNAYIGRNDFQSKYYQAWFGIYVIDAKNKLFDYSNDSLNSTSFVNIKKLLSIGVLDQTSWLYAMGDTSALTSTSIIEPKRDFGIIDKVFIDGQSAPVIELQMKSHSDLTDKVSEMTKAFAMPKKDYWQNQLSANHDLTINGFYIYWYNKASQTLKIIYGSGCIYTTDNLKRNSTYPLIKKEMLEMAKSASFISVK